jgi:cytidylate kinase
VVLHAAEKGNCVIVGRGSQLFLSNRPDTFRVFLYAPREDKVHRLRGRGKSEADAEQLVDTVDRERAHFIEKYFRINWPDRAVYHVMLNTAVGDETVAKTIMNILQDCDSNVRASA